MNKKVAISGAGGIVIALLGLGFYQSADKLDTSREPADEPPMIVQPGIRSATEIETEPAAVEQSPTTETVMGIEVRKDRNCDVERRYLGLGDGSVVEAFSCVPRQDSYDFYEELGNATLAVMAYDDWQAASVLGKRLVEEDLEKSRHYILRAVALKPDNVEPMMWLAAQVYSLRGDTDEARAAIANNYMLARTAASLDPSTDIQWLEQELREAGFNDADLAKLERGVRRNLELIKNVQLEVFGESSVREASSS